MKPIILTVCAWICLSATQAIGADNLVENPDLACDTNGWKTVSHKSGERDKHADFITYVADQGANGTKGCLKMTTQIEEGISFPSASGVYTNISKVLGSAESPAHLKVTFYAKAADQSTGYLHVGRLWGGGKKCIFPLSSEWEKFEAEISSPYDTDAILFCPSDKSGKEAINGEVLLDEVVVEDLGQ